MTQNVSFMFFSCDWVRSFKPNLKILPSQVKHIGDYFGRLERWHSHLSLSGNSLARPGRTLPAPGGSFGRTTPSSPHSPPAVSATTTAITLQSWKTSRSTFKMSSLKSLTKIKISSSFTKLCLLQSIIATKPSVGSSPITSIGFSRNVRFLSFFRPYGLPKGASLLYLNLSLNALPPPSNCWRLLGRELLQKRTAGISKSPFWKRKDNTLPDCPFLGSTVSFQKCKFFGWGWKRTQYSKEYIGHEDRSRGIWVQ